MNYISRDHELAFLRRNRDTTLIKVVTGVRRSGKSTILKIFREELQQQGVDSERIQSYNFDNLDTIAFREDYLTLYREISNNLQTGQMNYIFLDEIQWIPHFEEVVNSLFLRDDVDIYITGSNAYFLSGEFATMLTGRYVSLEMYPLSYAELYHHVHDQQPTATKAEIYEQYVVSSFPQVPSLNGRQQINEYLEGLYNTVLVKDVAQRLGLANVGIIERIAQTLFASIGSIVSMKKIADTLTSANIKTSSPTVAKYVDELVAAKLFYRAQRYDVAGRRFLEARDKYYAVDVGLRALSLSNRPEDFGHVLENIIFLELKRRGYHVYVGQVDKVEVDFVAIDHDGTKQYIQISLSTLDEHALARELRPFTFLSDGYPRLLLTLDAINKTADYDGVQKMNALDWLLADK
jgi:predicted AAA+ superfamily ATPase